MRSSDTHSNNEYQQLLNSVLFRLQNLEASQAESQEELRARNDQVQELKATLASIEAQLPDLHSCLARNEEIEHLASVYSAEGEPICNFIDKDDYRAN